MALSNYLWWVVVAFGPLLLVIAFIYSLVRRRRLDERERLERDREADRIYNEREVS